MSKWLDDYVRKMIEAVEIQEHEYKYLKAKDIDKDRNTFMGLYNKWEDWMIQYKN